MPWPVDGIGCWASQRARMKTTGSSNSWAWNLISTWGPQIAYSRSHNFLHNGLSHPHKHTQQISFLFFPLPSPFPFSPLSSPHSLFLPPLGQSSQGRPHIGSSCPPVLESQAAPGGPVYKARTVSDSGSEMWFGKCSWIKLGH